jgi:hypothetical protein
MARVPIYMAVALTVLGVYAAVAAMMQVTAMFGPPFFQNTLVRVAIRFSADGFLN